MRSKSNFILLACGLMISLLISACQANPVPSAGTLVVRNGTLIAADGSSPIPEGLVAMSGGRIVYAGAESGYQIPRGSDILDADGGTILPGFIDSHTHSTSSSRVRRAFLVNGVTAVCDLGTPVDELTDFSLSRVQEDPAARGIAAGPIITAPNGLPGALLEPALNHEVATPGEGRKAVEDLIQRGAEMIKVYLQAEAGETLYPMLDKATLEAIVEEAHQLGVPVRAHVTYIPLLEMAVSAGVDSVEHIPVNVPSAEMDEEALEARSRMLQSPDPLNSFFDTFPEYSTQLELMVERGIILVPTLDRVYGVAFRSASEDPELQSAKTIILGIVGRFHEMGGEVGLGTDYNLNIGMAQGIPLGELEWMLAAGLNPLDVIEASTRVAADACGWGEELGTLTNGKIGDLIVVDGDPLADFKVLENIQFVIKDGEIAYQGE